jgi:hypothetical protein
VYYVPKLERNIISLGQLTEGGYKIVLEENYLWGYDRERQLIMKVERSKNRLYYLDLDRVDPICDGILVEEQRSAPFPVESTHVTQDIICEKEKSGQPDGSPASSRPPWPEGGGLKEKDTLEEGPVKRKIRYISSELLNLVVASIIEGRTCMRDPENRPTRLEGGRAASPEHSTEGPEERGRRGPCGPDGAPNYSASKQETTRACTDSRSAAGGQVIPPEDSSGDPEEKSNPANSGAPDGIEANVPARKYH